jgi:RHS repeat-associated protein
MTTRNTLSNMIAITFTTLVSLFLLATAQAQGCKTSNMRAPSDTNWTGNFPAPSTGQYQPVAEGDEAESEQETKGPVTPRGVGGAGDGNISCFVLDGFEIYQDTMVLDAHYGLPVWQGGRHVTPPGPANELGTCGFRDPIPWPQPTPAPTYISMPSGLPPVPYVIPYAGAGYGKVHTYAVKSSYLDGNGNTNYDFGAKAGLQLDLEHVLEGQQWVPHMFITYSDRTRAEYESVPHPGGGHIWRQIRLYRGSWSQPDWETTYHYSSDHGGLLRIEMHDGVTLEKNYTNFGTQNDPIWRVTSFQTSSSAGTWDQSAPWNAMVTDLEYDADNEYRLLRIRKPARRVVTDASGASGDPLEVYASVRPTFEISYAGARDNDKQQYPDRLMDRVVKVEDVTFAQSQTLFEVGYDATPGFEWRVAWRSVGPYADGNVHTFDYPTNATDSSIYDIVWSMPKPAGVGTLGLSQRFIRSKSPSAPYHVDPNVAHISSSWKISKVVQTRGTTDRSGSYTYPTLTWEYEYAACGCDRLSKVIYPSGLTYEWNYDLDGRGLPIYEKVSKGTIFKERSWTWVPWFTEGGSPVDYRIASHPKSYTDATGFVRSYSYAMQANGGFLTTIVTGNNDLIGRIQDDAYGRPIWTEETPFTVDVPGNPLSTLRTTIAYMGASDSHPWKIKSIAESDGSVSRSRSFSYEGPGFVSTITDSDGRVTTFKHDVGGNRIEVTPPVALSGLGSNTFQPKVTLSYDQRGRLTRVEQEAFDEEGNPYANSTVEREIVYDSLGRPVQTRQESGALGSGNESWVTSYLSYQVDGRLSQVTDSQGRQATYEWDGHGRLFRASEKLNATETATREFSYSKDGTLLESKDATGVATVHVLDDFGRRKQLNTPDGREFRYEYDAANRLKSVAQYLGAAQLRKKSFIRDDSYKRITQIKSDAAGSPSATLDFTYNGLSRVARVVEQTNRSMSFFYDSWGNLARKTDDLVSPGNGNEIRYTRDAWDRVTEVVESLKHEGESQTTEKVYKQTVHYNAWGQVIQAQDWGLQPGGPLTTTNYGRDSLGNLTWVREPRTEDVNANERVTEIDFDSLGRVLEKRLLKRSGGSGSPQITLGVSYNDSPGSGLASIVTRTDGLLNSSVYEYDYAGRLVRRLLPGYSDASVPNRRKVWDYSYDLEGRLEKWIDGNGAIVKQSFDPATKQLKARWLAQMGSQPLAETCTNEEFEYDARLQSLRIAKTFWGFFGNLSGPSTSAQLFVSVQRDRDLHGRVVFDRFGYLDAGGGTPFVTKELISDWGPSGQAHDDLRFRHSLTTANGFKLNFEPDRAGKLKIADLTIPSVNQDPPILIEDFVRYRYEGARPVFRATNLNGGLTTLDTCYSFDLLRYLDDIQTDYGASPVYKMGLKRDLVGNVLHLQQEKVGRPLALYPQGGDVYALDGFDRLVSAQLGVDNVLLPNASLRTRSYQLDDAHNRGQVVRTDGATTATDTYTLRSGTNEYASKTTSGGEEAFFVYDGNGNLVSDGYFLYEYDYLDRLSRVYLITYPAGISSSSSSVRIERVSVEDQKMRHGKPTKLTLKEVNGLIGEAKKEYLKTLVLSKTSAPSVDRKLATASTATVNDEDLIWLGTYWYDCFNRRVYKMTPLESTFFAYDGWQCTDEFDGTLQPKKTYFTSNRLDEYWGYANYDGSAWVRFGMVQDHLGSVVRVTDVNGAVVERYEYDPYGKVTVYDSANIVVSTTQASVLNTVSFAAHKLDLETGLIYMRNRYYSPGLGRFLTQDPIGIWGDHGQLGSGFSYVAASPASSVDRHGLAGRDVHFYMVYDMAIQNGIDSGTSLRIAQASNFVDHSGLTYPLSGVESQRRLSFHFPVGPRGVVEPDNVRVRNLTAATARSGDAVAFGVMLHIYVDTWSHSGFGYRCGHASAGTKPDDPWRYPLKYPEMAHHVWRMIALFKRMQDARQRDYVSLPSQDYLGLKNVEERWWDWALGEGGELLMTEGDEDARSAAWRAARFPAPLLAPSTDSGPEEPNDHFRFMQFVDQVPLSWYPLVAGPGRLD